MSSKATTWAWEFDELDVYEKLILLRLADHANAEGSCWPGKDLLHKKCRQSKRKVDRSIQKLESLGLIKIQRRKTDTGKDKSNVYFLQFNQGRLFDEKPAVGVYDRQGCTADRGVPDDQVGVHHRPNRGVPGAPEPTTEPIKEQSHMAQPPAGDRAVHVFFEKELWEKRPRRLGTDNKQEALKALQESIKRGNKIEDIQGGFEGYLAHCKLANIDGTRYVMRLSKFLEADHWRQDWNIRTKPYEEVNGTAPPADWFETMSGIWEKAADLGVMIHDYPLPNDLIAELIKRLEAKGEDVPENLRYRKREMLKRAMSA